MAFNNENGIVKSLKIGQSNAAKHLQYDLIDESSTTIENYLLENKHPDWNKLLGIDYQELISRVDSSESKQD